MSLEAYESQREAYERMVENPKLSWRLRDAARLMLVKLDASRIEARSDETPQEVQPEGREPDPKGHAHD